MTGGPSITFTRKATVDQNSIRKSSNVCKTIVGVNASQLYPLSMGHEMPTGFYTRWEYDSEPGQFKARNNRTRNFENMVKSFYQELRRDQSVKLSKIERHNRKAEEKCTVSMLMTTAMTVKQYLKLWLLI